jgi:hypothetical protein
LEHASITRKRTIGYNKESNNNHTLKTKGETYVEIS